GKKLHFDAQQSLTVVGLLIVSKMIVEPIFAGCSLSRSQLAGKSYFGLPQVLDRKKHALLSASSRFVQNWSST
ncbi:MAG: hypothetical protein VX289_09110, partial [Candidatus Poribacteria bacterium]|nr:hypothetical protein [Candidatus Poribacteria bacterium]